jgi:hypothetical protein
VIEIVHHILESFVFLSYQILNWDLKRSKNESINLTILDHEGEGKREREKEKEKE